MSGLFASLNSSVSAIEAHSRALELAGKNLANVNNAGYARQRVTFGDRGQVVTAQGAESLGLEALGIEQIRDSLLDRQVLREISLTQSYTAQQSAYQRAQASLGQRIDRATGAESSTSTDTGIGAALDGLFNSFQSLATNPTDHGGRQNLLHSAEILTDRLQLADQRLSQTQADLDSQINTDLASANGLLASIANFNDQIKRFEINNPGSAVDLRDQRQAALEKLAGYIAFDQSNTSGGQIQISARDTTGASIVLVDGPSVEASLAFDGTAITAGGTALSLTSGSAPGALSARDGAIKQLRDRLDTLARQLVTSVNTAYQSAGSTANFFNPAGVTAGSIRLADGLTATTLQAGDGSAAGDNSIALAIAGLASQKFSTAAGDEIDGSFSGFFASTVSDLGQSLAGVNARVEEQTGLQEIITRQRDSVSGVSLDEEMADLVKFQRAFQASSRVFQTINELLENVISLGR
jgi:flagellar hook-associated protein 1 FlgK